MSILFAFAAIVTWNSPALAQAASPGGQAIVIQGVRDHKKSADDFLRKMVPPSMDEQLGRFEEPVCPGTIGLPENLKGEVLTRIRQVTAAAAIPSGKAPCTPNVLIIVVDDKKTLIEGMQRKREAYLYGISAERRKALANAPGPVAAWQISDVIGADGEPLRVDGDGFPRLFTTVPPSHIRSSTRSRILGAIIVVEQRGLLSLTTRQLADFALVRALAPIQQKESQPPNSSVLSLFNAGARPEEAPQSVTWWDFAMLKALADTRSDSMANVQRREIRDRIIQEMEKIPPQER